MTTQEKIEALQQEAAFHTSRSSGAGGQHVNKVETRVELRLDIEDSRVLDEAEKDRLRRRLSNRISKDDLLILSSQESRSQYRNKKKVLEKFERLVGEALMPVKKAKRKSWKAKTHNRLERKRRRSEKKRNRQKPEWP
ncbi:MAG: alternative ribosome rescue aminoacyl-tRNA hydrolase ArfB [Saprospiraceae bacterium]|nr:alternative ribosome rescue aminoacyl-tRNA hydrolase ArfB [Saprospiraceae bacterium]